MSEFNWKAARERAAGWRIAGQGMVLTKNSKLEAGPDGVKGGATVTPSEFQQLSEQIAALAAGLTARDRQLDALSEQIKVRFEAYYAILKANQILLQQLAERIDFEGKARRESDIAVGLLLTGLTKIVTARFDTQGLAIAGLESKLEHQSEQIAMLPSAFIYQITRQELAKSLKFRDLAEPPKQKQRRKGKK